MIRNYIVMALRNLVKQRGYSAINILGLAIGMATCLLILLWVADEWSFDKFRKNEDRLYRVMLKGRINDKELEVPISCAPLAKALVSELPEVQSATRIRRVGNFTVRSGEKVFNEARFYYADSNVASVMDLEFVSGNPAEALKAPMSMVVTPTIATKYFGDESPLGKMLTVDGRDAYKVTGVVKEAPPNSHWHFDFLVSYSSRRFGGDDVWLSNNLYTYVEFRPGHHPDQVRDRVRDMVIRGAGPMLKSAFGTTFEEFEKSGGAYGYYFQKVTDIHLHSHMNEEWEPNGNILYVYVFGIIAVFVLGIAVINFMNLATARSAGRAKEVGVRKTVGSSQKQLIALFMTESIVVSVMAMIAALLLMEAVLPSFQEFTQKALTTRYDWVTLLSLFAFAVSVGVVAGTYPSFVLSSFVPVKVLKGELRRGAKGGLLRSTLVVFQFAISIVLIIGTLVVYRQLKFVTEKTLGFTKEQVLVVDNTWLLREGHDRFRMQVTGMTGVSGMGYASTIPGKDIGNSAYIPEGWDASNPALLWTMWVDFDALTVLGVPMASGRMYGIEHPADSAHSLVINEAAAGLLGYPDPMGKRITTFTGQSNEKSDLNIIGVVKDFHFQSLHEPIRPLALRVAEARHKDYAVVRLSTDGVGEIISKIESTWTEQTGGEPFTYFFLDESFDSQYRAETAVAKTLMLFSGLGIFIACLGLIGLSTFAAAQRTKEVGIRKVMGASVLNVTTLLSREFVILVSLANVIAWPIAYFGMQRWLENFAYRVEIGVGVFIVAAVLAMIIALLTVSYQAVRAARANPVVALKYE